MKILLAHNYYQQPGGEDQSFAAEVAMLETHGHEVIEHRVHNTAIEKMSRLGVAARTIWNKASYREVRGLVRKHRPDIAHFNNTFPLISPAAYYAARSEGVPVVQTLRNYRLLCPGAFFYREQQVCEDCLGRVLALPGIRHGCYRGSRSATTVVAAMLAAHGLLGTWRKAVDVYIALTEGGRRKFIQGGLPADKIAVKPNFVYPDPGVGEGGGGYAVFVGRLSPEKGIATLLAAWKQLKSPLRLKIVGDGPLAADVQAAAAADPRIEWEGHQPSGTVQELVGEARFLVFPSQWYEGMPRTIIEAFAKGTPVVGSRMGAMQELIDDGRTGMLFTAGDAAELAQSAAHLAAETVGLLQMRIEARREYERKYAMESNYQQLMAIYKRAMGGNEGPGEIDIPASQRVMEPEDCRCMAVSVASSSEGHEE